MYLLKMVRQKNINSNVRPPTLPEFNVDYKKQNKSSLQQQPHIITMSRQMPLVKPQAMLPTTPSPDHPLQVRSLLSSNAKMNHNGTDYVPKTS
jgi:hypothetical protein